MDTTTVMVSFSILGERFTNEDITRRLEIEPSEFYTKGEKIKNRDIVRKETAWTISTEYEESLDINIQLNKIINNLEDKKNELIELKKSHQLFYKFFIIIKIEQNETPAIYLDLNTISFVNDIGAELDFDLYVN